MVPVSRTSLNIELLKSHRNLPGANELRSKGYGKIFVKDEARDYDETLFYTGFYTFLEYDGPNLSGEM